MLDLEAGKISSPPTYEPMTSTVCYYSLARLNALIEHFIIDVAVLAISITLSKAINVS
jgi:hypothetical protein